jgi:hypothetical protein
VSGALQSVESVLAGGADVLPGDTSAMDAVEAVLVAELRLELVTRVRPLSERGWLVQRAGLNELVVLDPELSPIWRLGLPAGRLGFVAVTDDLSLVALSRDGQVVFLDGTGRQLASVAGAHPQSSIGVFTADGAYLWVVLPGRGSENPVTASQELWLIEVARCSIVDRRRIGMFVDDCRPIRHPDGHTVGLSLWVDRRPAIGWAVAEHGRIDLRLVPWRDRVLADVPPGGSEYLTVSREQSFVPGRDDELWRHRLRDDRLVGALAVSAATHVGDAWDARSGYLTNELILASTLNTGWHLLVGTAPLGLLAEVAYPSPIAGSVPFPSGQGRWLTVGGGRVQGWVLPSPPGEQLRLRLA